MISISLLLSASALAAFHCEAGSPHMLLGDDSSAKLSEIGLPPEAKSRSFDVRFVEDSSLAKVEFSWPNDYMRLSRNPAPAFETADGSFAFTTISPGPCLFTDKGCLTQFSIVDRGQGDGKADLLIVPVGLSTDTATKKRSSMTILMRGICQRTDLKK